MKLTLLVWICYVLANVITVVQAFIRVTTAGLCDPELNINGKFLLSHTLDGNFTRWGIVSGDFCVVTNESARSTEGYCTKEGQYTFTVTNGSRTLVRQILIRPSFHCFKWHLTVNIRANDSGACMLLAKVWITQFGRQSFTEREGFAQEASESYLVHAVKGLRLINEAQKQLSAEINSVKLSQLLYTNGQHPLMTVAQTLDKEESMFNFPFTFNSTEGCWKGESNLKSSVAAVTVRSSRPVFLGNCLIRPLSMKISKQRCPICFAQTTEVKLDGIPFPRIFKDPCAPLTFLWSQHPILLILQGSSYNQFDLSTRTGYPKTKNLQDVVFTTQKIFLLLSGILFSVDERAQVTKIPTDDLPDGNITLLRSHSSCLEDNGFVLLVSLTEDKGYKFRLSDYNLTMFKEITHPLKQLFPRLIESESLILDARINALSSLVRILASVKEPGRRQEVLIDYDPLTSNWSLAGILTVNVTNFVFLTPSNIAVLAWSRNEVFVFIVESGRNISYYQTQENIVTVEANGQGEFVVITMSGNAIYGKLGAPKFAKFKVLEENWSENAVHLTEIGDMILLSKGRRPVFIPIKSEIESIPFIGQCNVLQFSHNLTKNLHFLDIGQRLQIKVELITSSKLVQMELLYPRNVLDVNYQRTENANRGIYKMILTVSVGVRHLDLNRFPILNTTLVLYLSGLHITCLTTKLMNFFIKIGCPPTQTLHFMGPPNWQEIYSREGRTSEQTVIFKDETLTLKPQIYQENILEGRNIHLSLLEKRNRSDFTVNYLENDTQIQLTFQGAGQFLFTGILRKVSRFEAHLQVTVKERHQESYVRILVSTVMVGTCGCLALLGASFLRYRLETIEEHEKEAELQRRQQELRYLATLQHYREQMVGNTISAGLARRGSSRKRSSLMASFSE